MRKVIDTQLVFGMIDISQIKFDIKSRDDIPQILMGLQYIYTQEDVRKKIFKILEDKVSPNTDKTNGRPGMDLWKILVMGSLRLNLNCDYDRLHEMVNNHKTIREMLGHSLFDTDARYHLQTIKDNVQLLTPETLSEINKVVVDAGHVLVKKKDKNNLRGRCDSFVVETNVHFPTDINLLFDATRKVIELTTRLCDDFGVSGWRQSKHNIKEMKKQVFKLQKLKHSSSKDPIKALKKADEIEDAYTKYVRLAKIFIEKATVSEKELLELGIDPLLFDDIHYFATHAEKQIDLITRRVIQGEKIPHEEKVFSVFEPHTEWVCKGKAGVPVELGLKVAILEDQIGFILSHQIMRNQTDEQVAVPIVQAAKDNFPALNCCSFDKGFHSPLNQTELRDILDAVALPKKGKLSKQEGEYQQSEQFKAIRKKHSAVESAINALEVHGLDRCPDKGMNGFERYVGFAVVARNIQIIGSILIKREQRRLKRNRDRLRLAA
jgi:hypothetical protein